MRGPFHSAFGHGGIRRSGEDVARPIASSLKLGEEHVDKIEQSHERCQALGVSRIDRPDLSPLGRGDLNVARDRNLRLYEHAAPVMEMLYEQIVKSESMVVLCDATGTVLHSIGDDEFLGRASKVALAPGVNWSESTKGTNAIGTALIEETPTLVHADEHYLHANHFLTCSAAPILDPRGNILGVLDVSGDHRSYHQHTMALVKMSARMIENHWLTDDYRNVMRLHFHSRVEFIGTLMEGILAVSPEGRLVGANRGALEQLGMSGAALRMHTLTTLFGTTVGALVDRFRSPLATPMPVQLNGGRPLHLHARFNWPVWTHLADQGGDAPRGGPAAGDTSSPGHLRQDDADTPSSGVASNPAAGQGMIGQSGHGAHPGHSGRSDSAGSGLGQLRTGDTQMASVVDKIRRVLDRDIPVLILGETGTGKELLARAIHHDSVRAKQPFVAVNCASIPDTLIEAELFGYEDGAFTGARRKGQVGKLVQANGGTLFLDEIGDMPVGLQAHLLRVLQERQVTPLGSNKSVAVDVSIICATHRNLREMIDAKLFREDLFYRLNGLAVRLPPLRERSDLMALVRRILDHQLGPDERRSRRLDLAPEVLRLFERYPWPGNVRQLFNVLRTAAVMAANEAVITREHLSDDFLEEARAHLGRLGAGATGVPPAGAAASSGPAWAADAPAGGGGLPGAGHGMPPLNQGEAPPGRASTAGTTMGQVDSASGVAAGWATSGQGPGQGSGPGPTPGHGPGQLPGHGPGSAAAAAWSGAPAASAPPHPAQAAPAGPGQIRSLEEQELEAIRQAVEMAGGNISEASKRLGISRNTIYRKLRWKAPR